MPTDAGPAKQTPLHDRHLSLGARMVPFAGYEMPVQYAAGILAEHRHTRAAASLFDVSHMGQISINGEKAAAAIERLVPADIKGLAMSRTRYAQLTNDQGGIFDDLMITRQASGLYLVVNAANKDADLAHLKQQIGDDAEIEPAFDRALLALQGPKAADVLESLAPGTAGMAFMSSAEIAIDGIPCLAFRAGYTGEDGFEISTSGEAAGKIMDRLLAQDGVAPAGLGARDSLRLEAGLCLHGHDIDPSTTPVEAALAWSIGKRRRAEGGFPGAEVILRQIADGPLRKRVGIRLQGRAPAREGAVVQGGDGRDIGLVTSGGFSPSLELPIAMGYVETAAANPGAAVSLIVRDRPLPGEIVTLPFVPHNYHSI